MYQQLKEAAYLANMTIARSGLIPVGSTWGNASQCDRQAGVFAIKPSGVDYSLLTVKDMVVVDLATGREEDLSLPPTEEPTALLLAKWLDNTTLEVTAAGEDLYENPLQPAWTYALPA